MTPIDRDALERALVACRAQDAGRAKQIDSMLSDEPWEQVARFAAYSAQIESLGLMPWQNPPCYADTSALDQPYGDPRAAREGAELALRMRRCGVSRWEPNPVRECERIEAEQRQAAK
jgi:hypothetical protein